MGQKISDIPIYRFYVTWFYVGLSVCLGPQKLDKPNVIIYCGKLEDKGYKNPKESELKNQQERRTKSYKIVT